MVHKGVNGCDLNGFRVMVVVLHFLNVFGWLLNEFWLNVDMAGFNSIGLSV